MSYRTLFCLGFTTLVIASVAIPALAVTRPFQNNRSLFGQEKFNQESTLIQNEWSTLIAAREQLDKHPPE